MTTITETFHPVSIEVLDVSGNSVDVTNPERFTGNTYGATQSGNYGQYYLVPGSQAETFG
jgi:hypothetical protein